MVIRTMISPLFCKILTEVAYCGNISAAAEKMNYSQGALSHAIKRTEEEVGFKIFTRSKYGVSLTTEGSALLPIAKKIVEYSDKMDETVASLHGLSFGKIKIGTYATMSMHFLPGFLKNFTSTYPGIKIELIEGTANEISNWLNDQVIDIALTSIQKSDSFYKIPLFKEPLVAVFSNETTPPLDFDNKFNIENFSKFNFITPMMDKRIDPEMLPAIESALHDRRIHVSSCDFISIMCLIKKQLGVSLLPFLVTSDHINDIKIVMTEPQYYRTIGLGIRNFEECSLASKKFIEALKEYTHSFINEYPEQLLNI